MKRLLLALLFCTLATCADAATCFWVGGTATWDNTNTGGGGTGGIKWASATGGATACAGSGTGGSPGSGDSATFDSNSGGGTVTVAATINGSNTIVTLSMGTFGGTLDFSVNNPSVTLASFSANGAGNKTLNMGNGTWTMTGGNTVWDSTSSGTFTLNANSSTLAFSGNSSNRAFNTNGKTYHTVSISSSATYAADLNIANNSATIGTLNVTAPARVVISGTSINVTNAFNISGSSATNPVIIEATESTTSQPTWTTTSGTATCNWCVLQGISFTGGATFTATNSFGYNNSGITITGPSGGGHIIGG